MSITPPEAAFDADGIRKGDANVQMNLSLVLVFIASLSTGCSMRRNKEFDYKMAHHTIQGVTIGARLMGSFTSSKAVTIMGSPYELFISFSSETKKEDAVVISAIELYDAVNNSLVFSSYEVREESFGEGSDGKYRAYFSVKNIDLNYVRHRVALRFKIKNEDNGDEKQVELYLDTDYKEHKSNDFWQKIMSV